MRAAWISLFAAFASACTFSVLAQQAPQYPAESLGGTSWEVVNFQGGDDKTLSRDESTGQQSPGTTSNGRAVEPAISGLPATFVGTIPCADCPGIRYQVNLLPDHTFTSRMSYLERNTQFTDHGSWQIGEDRKTLVLRGERGAREHFALRDADTMRQLDADGHEINSQFNYDLKRSPTFTPIETHSK